MLRTLPEEVEYLSLADYDQVLAGPRAADPSASLQEREDGQDASVELRGVLQGPVPGDPIKVYLVAIDYWLHQVSRYDFPAGIAALRVMPQTYPPPSVVEPDTYGDRTGLWGDGRDWLEYWASLGGYWVNLGIAADEDGQPYIAYESQWRNGDPIERLPDGRYPAFNFHG